MLHQRLKRERRMSRCVCVCVCMLRLQGYTCWTVFLCVPCCALYCVCTCNKNVCVCTCRWYHLDLQKQYELQCILNAPIESYVTADGEPNARLNNAYWCTIRYLNTILPLKNFSVFSYLRSILILCMNHLNEYSQDISCLNLIYVNLIFIGP